MNESDLLGRIGLEFCVEGPSIICRLCRFAIAATVDKLHDHLRDRHRLSISQRRAAVEHAQHLHAEADPTCCVPRPELSICIPLLAVYDGFICLRCSFKTISEITMVRHLSHEHKLPGSSPSYNALYRDAKLQTRLPRNRAKYWEIVIPKPSNILPAPPSLSLDKFLEDIHRREEMYRATADDEQLKDTGLQSFVLTSPWMNHTQWAAHYQGARRDILVNITKIRACSLGRELPVGRYEGGDLVSLEEDKWKMGILIAATDHAFDRCEETLARTSRPILCWLHTYHGTRFYPKPFKCLF